MATAKRKNPALLFFSAVMALVALDQVAKAAVRHFLPPSASVSLLGPLELVHWTNTGSVFGLFPGTSNYIAIISLVVVSFVIALYALGFVRQRLAVILLVAGLAGNTIDRLSRGFVTDFIYVRPWPAFNLADAFLTIGIVLFAASFLINLLPKKVALLLPQIFRKRKPKSGRTRLGPFAT